MVSLAERRRREAAAKTEKTGNVARREQARVSVADERTHVDARDGELARVRDDAEEKGRVSRRLAHKEAEVSPHSGPDVHTGPETFATQEAARHGTQTFAMFPNLEQSDQRQLDANGNPVETQMHRDHLAFLDRSPATQQQREDDRVARMSLKDREEYDKELDKQKPIECVVQTPNAIFPVDAKRGKDKVEAGQKCQIGDTVMLPPHVIRRHQNAGVGLSLVKSAA